MGQCVNWRNLILEKELLFPELYGKIVGKSTEILERYIPETIRK